MTSRAIRSLTLIAFVLLTRMALGGEAKHGWTKLELIDIEHKQRSVPSGLLRAFGADLISDYGSFAIVYARESAVDGLTAAARARGVTVRRRDELDVLRLPGADVDTREGIGQVPEEVLTRDYPNGKPGLFTIQLVGPPRREWIAELHAMGWSLARYVPNNGYIAVGLSTLRVPTRSLSFVQWVDFYHPYQKNAYILRDGKARTLVFDLPTGPALEETIAAIEAEAERPIRTYRGSEDTQVYATMPHGRAEKLLHQQLVIGVSEELTGKLSDERQVMSLTSNLDSTRSHPLPSSVTTYWDWVTSSSRCPDCANMPAAEWRISIADTGLDDGLVSSGHPDLLYRSTNGALFATNAECAGHCDWIGHGTMVAGIAAGNAATGYRDRLLLGVPMDDSPSNLGWNLGMGVAPTAGVLVTKITSTGYDFDLTKLEQFISDAVDRTPTVAVLNFSFEARGSSNPQGKYSQLSRRYDLAVRDANGNGQGRPQIFIAHAAGNADPSSYVSTNAMAKNILVVSGTENSRPFLVGDGWDCPPGEGFKNIMSISRMATYTDGYIKPDVLAPASQIVSSFTTIRDSNDPGLIPFCPPNVRGYYDAEPESVDRNKDEYAIAKGTSFAAPVGAGAALVVKRYLASTPQATSPALTKAMLIAGAQSIRDGVDKTEHPKFPGSGISSVPSEQQGFGRLSFEDILTGATKPVAIDESATRTFTTSGQSMVGRFRVRDAAKPVKAVLVWSDAAASPTESNPTVPPLVNDLNLEVRPSGGTTVYLGNRMSVNEESIAYPPQGPFNPDSVNNVELAKFSLTANQEFDAVVRSQVIAGDTNGDSSVWEQDFAIVILNAELVAPFAFQTASPPVAPTDFQALSTGGTVSLSWSAASGATSYLVQRKTSSAGWADVLPEVTSTSTTDSPSSPTGVVLYRVLAKNASGQSTPSSADVAFVGMFTDGTTQTVPPLTPVKAIHITEVRGAVNALREIGNLVPGAIYSAAELNPATLQNQLWDPAHWTSLMLNLSNARLAVGMIAGWNFRSPAPGSGVAILRSHVEDLRLGFQ